MKLLKKIYNFFFHFIGLNLKTFFALYKFPKMVKELIIFKKKGGKVDNLFPILYDYNDSAGSIKSHYFHQDIRVSSLIYFNKPSNHLDIGGRIDGFISNLSIFMKVDVLDIRNLDINKKNINFIKGDLMDPKFALNKKYKSISCLHTIEHFGLGRYGDKINPNGHIIGFQNIYKLLDNDASLYLSFPVSNISRIEFNAHRVFNINDIFEWIKQLSIKDLKLISFDLIDDNSELFENQNINLISKNINFGCGIYHFKKIDIHEKK